MCYTYHMKLSEYATLHGICYKTAWRHVRDGLITVSRTPTGRFEIDAPSHFPGDVSVKKVAIYCRVSSAENKANLHAQRKRLEEWCSLSGYTVIKVVEEIGSGVNDKRRRWLKPLS
jgi:putative resolvase